MLKLMLWSLEKIKFIEYSIAFCSTYNVMLAETSMQFKCDAYHYVQFHKILRPFSGEPLAQF